MAYDFTGAYEGKLHGAALHPQPVGLSAGGRLELTVLFTGLSTTLCALDRAVRLARGLNARIWLVVPQVVPYPLPLESPAVSLEFSKYRFQVLAETQAIETRVEIFLCRDIKALLDKILPARSMVVIGGRRRWWQTAEQHMARRLRRQDHQTIFVTGNSQEESIHA